MYARARKFAGLVVIAVFAVGLAACDIAVNGEGGFQLGVGAQARDEWTRSYKLSPGSQLEVINVNGQISAEPASGDAVEILAERTARASSEDAAKDLLARTEMREEVSDSRVRIEVRAPRWNGPGGQQIRWTIKVPRGVAVDLRTINGGVTLRGLDSDIRARATNGGIKGSGIKTSNVDASVTNGGVVIELANAPADGAIDLESVNGGVELALPAESKADITARCVNGGIAVTGLELEIVGEQTRRKVAGKLNGGGARVTLETTNGGVKLSRATT
jgi:hypothetical protein